MKGFKDLSEAFERKYPDSRRGRALAHVEMAEAIGGLVRSGKLAPSDISFKHIYEESVLKPFQADLVEALDHTAFPTVTGAIVSSTVIKAYEDFPKYGLGLVTVIPGETPDEEKIAGFTTVGTLKDVGPQETYQYMTPPAEFFKRVRKKKRGGLLAITEDIIRWDRTKQYLQRAAGIGAEVARDQDERIMKGIIDFDGNVYDLGALFASPDANGGTNLNAWTGSDTDISTAGFEKIDAILETLVDDKGRPIWVKGDRPLWMVPAGLKSKARKLALGEYGPLGTANLEVNLAKDQFDVVVNPYIASPRTSTVSFFGNPKRQFAWVEDIPLQVMQRSGQLTELGWFNDFAVEHKVRYQGGIGAVDTKYWHRLAGV